MEYINVGVALMNFIYDHNAAETCKKSCHTSHTAHAPVFCEQEVTLHLPQQNAVSHNLQGHQKKANRNMRHHGASTLMTVLLLVHLSYRTW